MMSEFPSSSWLISLASVRQPVTSCRPEDESCLQLKDMRSTRLQPTNMRSDYGEVHVRRSLTLYVIPSGTGLSYKYRLCLVKGVKYIYYSFTKAHENILFLVSADKYKESARRIKQLDIFKVKSVRRIIGLIFTFTTSPHSSAIYLHVPRSPINRPNINLIKRMNNSTQTVNTTLAKRLDLSRRGKVNKNETQ